MRNVQLQRAALGAALETQHLQIMFGGQTLGGLSRIVEQPTGTFEDVTTVRLDDVLPPGSEIAVLQLDVEFHEHAALAGSIKTIQRCRPLLILETVPPTFVASTLIPLGYRIVGTVCENTVLQAS